MDRALKRLRKAAASEVSKREQERARVFRKRDEIRIDMLSTNASHARGMRDRWGELRFEFKKLKEDAGCKLICGLPSIEEAESEVRNNSQVSLLLDVDELGLLKTIISDCRGNTDSSGGDQNILNMDSMAELISGLEARPQKLEESFSVGDHRKYRRILQAESNPHISPLLSALEKAAIPFYLVQYCTKETKEEWQYLLHLEIARILMRAQAVFNLHFPDGEYGLVEGRGYGSYLERDYYPRELSLPNFLERWEATENITDIPELERALDELSVEFTKKALELRDLRLGPLADGLKMVCDELKELFR